MLLKLFSYRWTSLQNSRDRAVTPKVREAFSRVTKESLCKRHWNGCYSENKIQPQIKNRVWVLFKPKRATLLLLLPSRRFFFTSLSLEKVFQFFTSPRRVRTEKKISTKKKHSSVMKWTEMKRANRAAPIWIITKAYRTCWIHMVIWTVERRVCNL